MQPSRIHHVGLPVSDLDISVAWYREALGLTHEAATGVPGGCRLHGRADRRAARAACSGCSALYLGRADRGATRRRPPLSLDSRCLDDAHARAVEAGGRSVWTPRDTPEPGLRIAFVADPDGNLVGLLSRDGEAPPT